MKPSRPPITDPEKAQEEIVAYLDGELSSDDSREVEECLAADPQYRDRLRQFEKSWNLLDELPRTEAPEKFAASTVEMIAVRQADEFRSQQQQWPRQYLRGWVVSASGVTLALLLGFGVVAGAAALLSRTGMVQSADARLLSDLPVLVNLDLYQQVDSLELLKELDKSNLFSLTSPIEVDPLESRAPLSPFATIGRTAEERESWVRNLVPADKKELAEKLDRFDKLPAETQQQLRELESAVSADPRAEMLRDVLTRYYQWLITLTPDQRAELRGLAPAQRLARITQLRGQDQQKLVRLRAMDDLRAVVEWAQKIAERSEPQLTASLPQRLQDEARQGNPAQRRQRLTVLVFQQWSRHGFGKNPDVTADEFNELKKKLSPGRAEQMERATGMAAQWEVLTGSMVAEIKPKLSAEKRQQLESGEVTAKQQWPLLVKLLSDVRTSRRSVGDDELWRYFREDLTKEERESFKHLPRDEFMQQLRARYLKTRKPDRPEANHPGAGHPGEGEGPRGPGGRPPRGGPGGHFRGPPPGPPDGHPQDGRPPEGPPGEDRAPSAPPAPGGKP